MNIYIIFRDGIPVVVNQHMSLFEDKELADWFVKELARERARKALDGFGKDWTDPNNAKIYNTISEKEAEKYLVVGFSRIQ